MAETLGMLCDKLTIVKLKQYHTNDVERAKSLNTQEKQLHKEIDEYINAAVLGTISSAQLTFASNKVFKKEGNETPPVAETIAAAMSQLADVNCRLWHEVEKGYDIDSLPDEEKGPLIKRLAVLNLERNNCIDAIDVYFKNLILSKNKE